MKRIAFAVTALAVIGSMVGCGGGSSSSSGGTTALSGESSKADYIERADAVCADFQGDTAPLRKEAEEIEESPNPESSGNLARLAEILKEANVSAEEEYAALEEVEPPQADRSLIDSMIGKAEKAGAYALEGAEALEEGELSEFSEVVGKAGPLNEQAKGMAESYGFKVCGQIE